MPYIIGIDPDSKAHGVAIYKDGVLVELRHWELAHIIEWIHKNNEPVVFSVENVMQNKFVYGRNVNKNKNIQSQIAMKVGRCQQAQVELERILEHLSVPVERHRPQRGNWANNKAMFEKVTGWKKRSNEDTRSAAYFGWLATKGGAI